MKKILLVLALVAIIATGTAFADHPGGFGIGVVGTYGSGYGGALSLKLPDMPIFWAINISAGDNNTHVGVQGDYYFIDADLIDKWLGWYIGVGGFAGIGLGGNSLGLNLGVR